MTRNNKSSILFLTKEKDSHCLKAIDFIKNNFDLYEIYEGKWGDPLPKKIESWEGDYIISYLSRWIVPERVIKNSRLAAINFHPASPDYPGIGCTNFALYEEAKTYGVTCHHMEPKVDTGAIVSVKKFPIHASETVSSLLLKTYDSQLELFYKIMKIILKGKELPVSKDKWIRKPFTRNEFNKLSIITPDMDREEIKKRIRATSHKSWQPQIKIGGFLFEYKKDSQKK